MKRPANDTRTLAICPRRTGEASIKSTAKNSAREVGKYTI